ncbi:MAG: GTPase Era, partial [Woeseiaceae bacterium]
DQDLLDRIARVPTPAFAVLNKIDRLRNKDRLLGYLEETASRHGFAEIIPVSALRKDNIDELLDCIPRYLPVSPPLFPADAQTDRSDEFRAAEIVREKLTLLLRQELPYGLTVQVEQFERRGKGFTIHAVIWVERESQKGMVVGKGGENLKRVGRAARLELRREFAAPVHLELWVKVRANWSDSEQDLKRLGYELP